VDEGTLADPVEEARRLIRRASERGLTLRAVGGVAVWLRAPSLHDADPPRRFHDIDVIGPLREKRSLASFLEGEGYEPNRRFNTLAGDRLMFGDPANERRLDVFLDRIEMCHTLNLRRRIAVESETLPVADLLLTKLQIVRLTDRDVQDLAALLADHPLANGTALDPDAIDLLRMKEVCCGDWGWWRTVTGNISFLEELWAGDESGLRAAARERGAALREHLERAPKRVRWRARALVGERVPWYQEPEEVHG
jgi:hypothetical protein